MYDKWLATLHTGTGTTPFDGTVMFFSKCDLDNLYQAYQEWIFDPVITIKDNLNRQNPTVSKNVSTNSSGCGIVICMKSRTRTRTRTKQRGF